MGKCLLGIKEMGKAHINIGMNVREVGKCLLECRRLGICRKHLPEVGLKVSGVGKVLALGLEK